MATGQRLGLDRQHVILLAAGGGARFMAGAASGELPAAMLASLGRAFAGGALGIAIGLLCGLLLALRPRAGQILTPTLNVLRHIALFARLPPLTAWVGNDNGGKIVFIAPASSRCFSTLQAVSQRDPQLDEVAKVLRFGPLTRLRTLILPGRRRAYLPVCAWR